MRRRSATDIGTPALLVALALGLGARWWALGGPPEAPEASASIRPAKKESAIPARRPAPHAASVVPSPRPEPERSEKDDEMAAWLTGTLKHPVRCRLSAPLPDPAAGALHFGRPDSYDLAGMVMVIGDILLVDAWDPDRAGTVFAELPEGRVLAFELEGDPLRCEPDPVVLPEAVELATVRLVVENAGTAFQTHASGCSAGGASDEHGVVELTIPIAELTAGCTVTVTRIDGQLWSAPAEVELGPEDADQDVPVEFPEWRTAGLGVRLDVGEDGVGIETVFPDTPAEAAGLQPGDRLLSADGHAVPADADAARSLFTGPEGTDVVLEVESDGAVRTVRVTRAVIEE